MKEDYIASAYALDSNGLVAAISKMAFGNQLGVKVSTELQPKELFANGLGNIVAEVSEEALAYME